MPRESCPIPAHLMHYVTKAVARLGLEGLFAGRDYVVGGDRKTRRSAVLNKFLGEQRKARRFAVDSREQ